jgi:type II secretion system protein E
MSQLRALLESLIAAGCNDQDAAELLALKPPAGSTWTVEVLNSGKADEALLTAELGKIFRTPVGNIEAGKIDRQVLTLLPGRFVFKHHILPIAAPDENTVLLATYDVFNQTARRLAQQQLTGKKVQWQLVPRSQLLRALRMAYGVGADVFEEILKNNRAFESIEQDTSLDITNDDPEASVVKFVNQVIREAITERATDIHVEPLENDLRIRYRVDGILHEIAVPPQLRVLQSAIISRLKVMAHMDIAERRLPQDGRFRIRVSGKEIDLRISMLPTTYGEKIVIRILDKGALSASVASLGLDEYTLGTFKKAIDAPHGMILVTGPTGSGKTTTLYSVLAELNSPEYNIVTVEDPIEYQLSGVNQVAVKTDIGLTFAEALRSILRQDPDICMIGEIRDNETADIAVKAALTGHQVLSTLHTNDAAGAIARLDDMGIEPFLISSSVLLTCAQRLLRRVCPNCKEEMIPEPELLQKLGIEDEGTTFYRGAGCDRCKRRGYVGRCAVLEVLPVSEAIRRLIIKRASAAVIKNQAISEGMKSLRMAGIDKAREGITTLEEVLRTTAEDH